MAFFKDPSVDGLMDKYLDADEDPEFLYPGTQAEITKKLQDWIPRRVENNQKVMASREASQANMKALAEYTNKRGLKPHLWSRAKSMEHQQYCFSLDKNSEREGMRAYYLLNTLRHHGISWPELRYNPAVDGGVCSYLGTVDPNFDAMGTMLILEDKENEERLRSNLGQLTAQCYPISPSEEAAKSSSQPSSSENSRNAKATADQKDHAAGSNNSGKDNVTELTDTMKENLSRANEIMGLTFCPGTVFYQGKLTGIGKDEAQARAKVQAFIDAHFEAGSTAQELFGENVLYRFRPKPTAPQIMHFIFGRLTGDPNLP